MLIFGFNTLSCLTSFANSIGSVIRKHDNAPGIDLFGGFLIAIFEYQKHTIMAKQTMDKAAQTDAEQFKQKHKDVPVGDQKKAFTPEDYRKIRQFFKHSTSDEIRQWIITAMDNNKTFTDNEVTKATGKVREEYLGQLHHQAEKMEYLRDVMNKDGVKYGKLLKNRNTLLKWIRLPWYKRMFTAKPVFTN